ncbi:DNA binding/DNA topoisomerase type I [Salpingoeca rosetta]|uniref:DNA topoisomerase I n=1 Tax=Salpingoeca rosetta (strain ATCC 50818 / BSB-021) TaxID=946362 RepID=F2UM37_SALR5|nr:DNA binding/DNA topoisomerase type I [Salpingoeca rosetta]EGD78186.1 DNA binding/DNA topoisomerase type I [Salpingoeca rosetta]|eukprot:XP_004989862.1 DNA binding/DNA topoisomerase type I [Salpingoeca rosetta]
MPPVVNAEDDSKKKNGGATATAHPTANGDDDSDDDTPLTKLMAKKPEVKEEPMTQQSDASDKSSASDSGNGDSSISHPNANDDGDDDDDDDDVPLAKMAKTIANKPKEEATASAPATSGTDANDDDDDDDDDVPLQQLANKTTPKASPKKKSPAKRTTSKAKTKTEDDDEDYSPAKKRAKASGGGTVKKNKQQKATPAKRGKKTPKTEPKAEAKDDKKGGKRAKKPKKEEEVPVYRWWEDEVLPEGQYWRTLEHRGPMFAPPYQPLPKDVYLLYDGKPYHFEPAAEEVATFYAAMLERDYVKKPVFNKNFFADWKTTMTAQEKKDIKDLKKCDFSLIHRFLKQRAEERKGASKEEKQKRKEENDKIKQEYGFAIIDGRRAPVGNFKIEPPGLFQGRGEHPKMGKLKRRVLPEQVIINIGKEAKVPEPPAGHRWKEVRHDNKVSWLAAWVENIQKSNKYVMLAPDSHIKGRTDWKKYELARSLHKCVQKIRDDYTKGLKSKLMFERQRSTALYFIDKLALRAGGEKDADESADTVGCCSLRVEHVTPLPDDELEFDFLGKDSIRYYNKVKVDHRVWKNIGHFKKGKSEGDDLFDRLSTSLLNEYLKELMPGLSAKVFRTYNASITLQDQLKSTPVDGSIEEKMLAYQRANRQVAILCNHQRAAPKTHDKQMERMDEAIQKIKDDIAKTKKERKALKAEVRTHTQSHTGCCIEGMKRKLERLELRLKKKEIAKIDKEENKTIALSTSKLNYLDPRISVAWCKKHDVPIEKVYNPTQRRKFRWAIEMVDKDFVF